MNKRFFKHDNKLWIVHRSIPDAQMLPRAYGYNSDDAIIFKIGQVESLNKLID